MAINLDAKKIWSLTQWQKKRNHGARGAGMGVGNARPFSSRAATHLSYRGLGYLRMWSLISCGGRTTNMLSVNSVLSEGVH